MPPKESESLAFLKVGEAVSQGLYYGSKSIYPTVQAVVTTTTLRIVNNWMSQGIKMYDFTKRPDNKRLVHLASHGKKKRTRKKNIRRLLKKYEAEQKTKGE